jgi:hypothetical protein
MNSPTARGLGLLGGAVATVLVARAIGVGMPGAADAPRADAQGAQAVASPAHPNEPAGMTVLHSHDGTTLKPQGWHNAVGQISIVRDPERGSVLELRMSPQTTPGSGTARIDTYPEVGFFGATRLYVAFWEKLSPAFKGNNGSGSLKNVIVHTQATYGGMPNGAIHLPGFINDPANVDGRIRIFDSFILVTDFHGRRHNPADNDQVYSADAGDVLSRGNWHFIENVVDFNSRGEVNGSVKTWVDGALVASATGIKATYDGTLRATGIELTNVWGGGGTPIAADNYYRFKDFYVSGGFARPGERPSRWVITAHEGTTVAAGSDVHLTAQLVDENGNSVDICGLQPKFSVTGGAKWEYWNGVGVYEQYAGCERGRQLFTLHTARAAGTRHVITVEDAATVNNGLAGDRRMGTATVTTR